MSDHRNFEPTFVVGDSEREWFLGWAEGYGSLALDNHKQVPIQWHAITEHFEELGDALAECDLANKQTADPDNHIHKVMEGREWRVYRIDLVEVAKPPKAVCTATITLQITGTAHKDLLECVLDDGHKGRHENRLLGERAVLVWSDVKAGWRDES
jgi:hypothetical protein